MPAPRKPDQNAPRPASPTGVTNGQRPDPDPSSRRSAKASVDDHCGTQPSSRLAREQSSRGTMNAMSSQPRSICCSHAPPAEIHECSEHTGRDVNGPRAERGCYVVSSDWRFGSNVERPRGASIDHLRDRLGDVIGVNKRNAQAPIKRQKRQPRNQLHRYVFGQSVPHQPAGRRPLQDETGQHPGDRNRRASEPLFVFVEKRFRCGLVAAVRRRCDSCRRPRFIHALGAERFLRCHSLR
jgi:hypothetical protein